MSNNNRYLNPITKGFILALLIIFITFTNNMLITNIFIFVLIICLFSYNLLSIKNVLYELRTIYFLLLLVAIFSVNLQKSLLDNLYLVSNVLLRTSNIFLLAIFYLKTSDVSEMIYFWEKLFVPLKLFGFNNKDLAQIMVIALRYVPILLSELERIKIAQSARGINYDEIGIKNKIKTYISIVVPLLVISLQKAENLALAMEARGYNIHTTRSSYKTYNFSYFDLAMLFLSVLAIFLYNFGTKINFF